MQTMQEAWKTSTWRIIIRKTERQVQTQSNQQWTTKMALAVRPVFAIFAYISHWFPRFLWI